MRLKGQGSSTLLLLAAIVVLILSCSRPRRTSSFSLRANGGDIVRKGKSVIGKDVLSLEDGVKLHRVSDVIVDPAGRRLVALVVDEGGFMSSSRSSRRGGLESSARTPSWSADRTSSFPLPTTMISAPCSRTTGRSSGRRSSPRRATTRARSATSTSTSRPGRVLGYEVSSGLLGDAAKGTSYLGDRRDHHDGQRRDLRSSRIGCDARGAGRRAPGCDAGCGRQARRSRRRRPDDRRGAHRPADRLRRRGRRRLGHRPEGSTDPRGGRRRRQGGRQAARPHGFRCHSWRPGGGAGAKDALGAAGDLPPGCGTSSRPRSAR